MLNKFRFSRRESLSVAERRRALMLVGLVAVVSLAVRFSSLQAVTAVSTSMRPALQAGDSVFVERYSSAPSWGEVWSFYLPPDRLSLVPRLSTYMGGYGVLLKRVIGLPGDVLGWQGGVLRKETVGQVAEPWLPPGVATEAFGPLRVPRRGQRLAYQYGGWFLDGLPAVFPGGRLQQSWCAVEGDSPTDEAAARRLFYGRVETDAGGFVVEDQYLVVGDDRGNSMDSRCVGFIPAGRFDGRVWLLYWPSDGFWQRLLRRFP